MTVSKLAKKLKSEFRSFTIAKTGEGDLGPLALLPGTWRNLPSLPGRGWNMIALPFSNPKNRLDYRLLLNQYNEELKFTLVDKRVPNRGINRKYPAKSDQFVVTLDYEQVITQIAGIDHPQSHLVSSKNSVIHHEPGLWLNMINHRTNGINIARLATIPHGDSVLALGTSTRSEGYPEIPEISGLPVGVPPALKNPYLAPYKKFSTAPFKGLFNPVFPNALLTKANEGVKINRTTTLEVDTTLETGGIVNIPFIVKQANAAAMKSTFWIQELDEKNEKGKPKLRLQYSQVVMLDFFKRRDGAPGLISWPHISINTMEKIAEPEDP